MPVIILGGIYGGIVTPTEAAAVAVIYALPVGFLIYKGLNWKNLFESGKEAGTAVGAIMVMILFSMILSQMFVMESVPQQVGGSHLLHHREQGRSAHHDQHHAVHGGYGCERRHRHHPDRAACCCR